LEVGNSFEGHRGVDWRTKVTLSQFQGAVFRQNDREGPHSGRGCTVMTGISKDTVASQRRSHSCDSQDLETWNREISETVAFGV